MTDILVVDDEEPVRYTIGKALGRAGHGVREAADGVEALDEIGKRLPDLVITDIIMPNVEGVELVVTLHERFPALPIIAISGGGRVDKNNYLSMIEVLGASAVMAKPFDERELVRLVERLLAERGRQQD
jgi:CheY-like chemotaxis protein